MFLTTFLQRIRKIMEWKNANLRKKWEFARDTIWIFANILSDSQADSWLTNKPNLTKYPETLVPILNYENRSWPQHLLKNLAEIYPKLQNPSRFIRVYARKFYWDIWLKNNLRICKFFGVIRRLLPWAQKTSARLQILQLIISKIFEKFRKIGQQTWRFPRKKPQIWNKNFKRITILYFWARKIIEKFWIIS